MVVQELSSLSKKENIVFGFEKNAKSNISSNEEKAFKIVAKSLLAYSDVEINKLIKEGALVEVENE